MARKLGEATKLGDKRKGNHPRTIAAPKQPTKAKKVPVAKPQQFKSKKG